MTVSDGSPPRGIRSGILPGIDTGPVMTAGTDHIILNTPSAPVRRSWLPVRAWTPRQVLKKRLDEAIGQAPDRAIGVLVSLIAEGDLRAYDTRRSSRRWGRAYYLLGLPAAVLATVAGAAGLASTAGRIPAAIVALAAAGLATAATFLNSNENKQQNNRLSAAWQGLADDVRLAVIRYNQQADGTLTPPEERHLNDQLINEVILFNKRKGALLRGELPSGADHPSAGS